MTMRYTRDHEWIRLEGEIGVVGISVHAAEQLGDVVAVDLPAIGKALLKGGEAAAVESVKAASDVFAPVAGEVLAVNGALANAPETVNADPEGAGWFFRMRVADPKELDALMSAQTYQDYLATLG